MQLSRYCKVLEKDGICAIFHALKPEPFFVDALEWRECVESGGWDSAIQNLMRNKCLLIESDVEDDRYRDKIKLGYVDIEVASILYLVLTKHCNLSCRQCFQYERHQTHAEPLPMMTAETARAGIDSFIRHLERSNSDKYRSQILFYGGEPLLNWRVYVEAVEYINSLRGTKLPDDIELMTITNGTVIRDKHAAFMAKHDIRVALSVDGPKEDNDAFRIYPQGHGAFEKIERGLKLLQKHGIKVTLSITVTPRIASKLVDIVRWAKQEMGAVAISFNMIGGKSFEYISCADEQSQYNDVVTQGLIDAFKEARRLGLYEDRIGRKIEGFVEHAFSAADCGAVGNQLIVQPDGAIAYCHASEEYNGGSVFDEDYYVFDDLGVREWKDALPINSTNGCQDCYAISTCGYGCFHHVKELGKRLSERDSQYCLHNRRTFDFMVWDLYENLNSE